MRIRFSAAAAAATLVMIVLVSACGSTKSSSDPTATTSGTEATVSNPVAQRRPQSPQAPNQPGVAVDIKGSLSGHAAVASAYWADPFAFTDGDQVYSYATNAGGANIPVARSSSATQATYLGDAMPTMAAWTHSGDVWAPSVYRRDDGTYVMYYDSVYGISMYQCVGVATSKSPAGPFVDANKDPLVCPTALGGAIDASMLKVDGKPYLVYKSDGNCCKLPTSIWSVPLSDDLTTTVGQPTKLITNDKSWEGDVVEAPTMVRVGDRFYLFYSGNDWNTKNYAVGYAVCESITGPCTKPSASAWGPSFAGFEGPGGASFLTTDNGVDLGALKIGDQAVMVFHAWPKGQENAPAGLRELFLSMVTFDANGPRFTAVQ